MTKQEDSINNTFQIKEEFKFKDVKKSIYKSPLPRKRQRFTAKASPRGKVKTYTEEEIYLYRLKKYGSLFNNLTICN